jgi:hypothetical protein
MEPPRQQDTRGKQLCTGIVEEQKAPGDNNLLGKEEIDDVSANENEIEKRIFRKLRGDDPRGTVTVGNWSIENPSKEDQLLLLLEQEQIICNLQEESATISEKTKLRVTCGMFVVIACLIFIAAMVRGRLEV